MERITYISSCIAVARSLTAADIPALAHHGFRALISNRLDNEEDGQLNAGETAALARQSGIAFRHLPVAKHEVLDMAAVETVAAALASLPGPIVLACQSGTRSALLWAAARAANEPIDGVLATLSRAGFDFEDMREDIVAAGAGLRAIAISEALDCAA